MRQVHCMFHALTLSSEANSTSDARQKVSCWPSKSLATSVTVLSQYCNSKGGCGGAVRTEACGHGLGIKPAAFTTRSRATCDQHQGCSGGRWYLQSPLDPQGFLYTRIHDHACCIRTSNPSKAKFRGARRRKWREKLGKAEGGGGRGREEERGNVGCNRRSSQS